VASRIPSIADCENWNSADKMYKLYNAGDFPIPFRLYFDLPQDLETTLTVVIS
jgi:hypothetical protein